MSRSSIKAAAVGALGFHLDHHVKARVTKCSYGIAICVPYDNLNPDHKGRNRITLLSGQTHVDGIFDTILSRVSRI